jgi:hypothetical protein
MQGALDGLLTSGLSDDAWGSAPHDKHSQALNLAQHGMSPLQRYENSGVLAELEEGINAPGIASGFIPENHPMKPACLNNLGNPFRCRFKRLGDVVERDHGSATGRPPHPRWSP